MVPTDCAPNDNNDAACNCESFSCDFEFHDAVWLNVWFVCCKRVVWMLLRNILSLAASPPPDFSSRDGRNAHHHQYPRHRNHSSNLDPKLP